MDGAKTVGEGSKPGIGRQCSNWPSARCSTAQRTTAAAPTLIRGTPRSTPSTAARIASCSAHGGGQSRRSDSASLGPGVLRELVEQAPQLTDVGLAQSG